MGVKKSIRFSVLVAALSLLILTAKSQLPAAVVPVMAKQVAADSTHTDAFFEDLLKQYPQYFNAVLANRKGYNVQVIYTKVDRGANGIAALKHYYFNVNSNRYFYPALAVKLPVAILTHQKLNELKVNGIDKNTTMLTDKAYSGQTAVYNDPTTPDGKPTIAQYLKKMLVGGDDDAYNRLYEFLGQQYINDQLHQKGYANAQLTQRLNEDLNEDEDRHTNPIKFLALGNKLLYQQPMQYNINAFTARKDSLGAQDFSKKNRLGLEDLHNMLISLIFPNKVTSSQRFTITDDDKKFILKYMSQLPTETINPPYKDDTATYYPAYIKYLLYGSQRDTLSKSIRIFNTTGEDNGQLIDVAYVVDFDKKIEFFLSAVIDCDNEVTGLSFMKHLGEIIYEYETKREKRILPDLGEVKFEYDGR